jgi:SAM-dependent methyltransferase
VTTLEQDLAEFYDEQAAERSSWNRRGERARRRDDFVALLRAEERSSVIEFGTGTGQDAAALQATGLTVAGVDLSPENVRYARERGIDCRQASLLDMPFDDDSFDAGWTMSTLLHIPDHKIGDALTEILRVLRPGVPLAVGLWGSDDRVEYRGRDGTDVKGFFRWRSDNTVREMLDARAAIEHFETWPDPESANRHYQYCIVRTPTGD